ncbi:MBL fold metallo-hydrolase [Vulgatibacter sp.]|uniref:MBL fold metallo-hydrolase n=1 Tax=Vulgatibacter sp. TaxID=1971226 RepID=UPI00356776B3
MLFRQLFDNETSSYTYLLADEETREAILIDPVIEQVERDVKVIGELGLRLLYTVETHVHADHVTGGGALRERLGSRTVVPAIAKVPCADVEVKEGDEIRFGKYTLRVLETPGHTDACVSYVGEGRVFTGDTLLVRGCGRTDFQSGSAEALYDSVTGKLFQLPPETLVYPAHDYKGHTVSSVLEEREHNPRLAHRTQAEFVDLMRNLKLALPKKIHEAVPANMACGVREGVAHA